MGHREASEGQDVGQGVLQHLGGLREVLPELCHHSVRLGVDLLGGELLVDGAHHGSHAGLGPFGHSGQPVGHEGGAAALPTSPGKHRGDSVLQTLVGI